MNGRFYVVALSWKLNADRTLYCTNVPYNHSEGMRSTDLLLRELILRSMNYAKRCSNLGRQYLLTSTWFACDSPRVSPDAKNILERIRHFMYGVV